MAKQMSDKHLEMFLLMYKWLQNKEQKKSIADYLKKQGYQSAIIYGMSYLGKSLYRELKSENYEVKDLVDQAKHIKVDSREVKNLNDPIDTADVIIVTAIYNYEEIEKRLRKMFEMPVLSLDDVIYKMT